MATNYPKPEYAHIASLIRSKMEEYQWRKADLNRMIGVDPNRTTIYTWLNGSGAPNAKFRVKLAKALDVDESELMPKGNVQLPVTPRESKVIVAYKNKPRAIHEPPRVLTHRIDPLSFKVLADGSARIQLDVTMPLDNAKALLRMILDADVIYK